jgi:hypothetical protein
MAKHSKMPVSARAVIQRINRKLRPDREKLRVTRSDLWRQDVGDYYVIDCAKNWITQKHVDPEELGRRLQVLQPWECIGK